MYDIVFIGYNEKYKDKNWKRLTDRFPMAKRVDGVKGLHQAHIKGAKMCWTKMFWIVDADALILDNFNLTSYNSMKSLTIPENLLINQTTMTNFGTNNSVKRHIVLDNIFSNSTETSLITSTFSLELHKRLNRTNVKVLAVHRF